MKKILLGILSISYLVSFGTGLTIEKSDLKLTIGNKWYMAVTPGQSISIFTSTGSGISWDLSSYESATQKDTIVVSAPTSGTGSVLSLKSTIIPETNYLESSTDYSVKTLNNGGVNYPLDGDLSGGLPHSYLGNYNDNTTAGGWIPLTVAGGAIAEGQITTSYGTFDCIFIQETFNIGGTPVTYYYWETKEYGKIAYLVDGNLTVMVDNNFNTPTSAKEISVSNFNVYPNPSTDQFTVKGDLLENVKIFDTLGNLVLNSAVTEGSLNINTNEFKTGLYFVQATSLNGVSTKSVIVK